MPGPGNAFSFPYPNTGECQRRSGEYYAGSGREKSKTIWLDACESTLHRSIGRPVCRYDFQADREKTPHERKFPRPPGRHYRQLRHLGLGSGCASRPDLGIVRLCRKPGLHRRQCLARQRCRCFGRGPARLSRGTGRKCPPPAVAQSGEWRVCRRQQCCFRRTAGARLAPRCGVAAEPRCRGSARRAGRNDAGHEPQ